MYEGAASVEAAAADVLSIARLRHCLELQLEELETVRAGVDVARSRLPTPSTELWRGLAQLSYGLGLSRLEAELATLGEHLDTACNSTRQAIESLGNRVG